MKSSLTACTALLALLSFIAIAHAQPGCATVQVSRLQPGQGPLMIAAYADAASYRKKAVTQLQVNVTNETMQLPLCGLSGDRIAVGVYQDLNDNGKLDANPFGVPTEPWGFSGKPARMGAPSWEEAQVAVDGSVIVVNLGH